jgi:hypothetical protein
MIAALLLSAAMASPAAPPAALPGGIRVWLDHAYPGWRVAPAAPQIDEWFRGYRLSWQPSAVQADFNGDRVPDWAVQILTPARRQLVIAFLANRDQWQPHTLADDPEDPYTYLILYKKGEKDFDFERMKPFRYSSDALGILYFHKTAVTLTWRDTGWKKREAPGDEEVEAARER